MICGYKGCQTDDLRTLLNINQNRKIPDRRGGIPTNLPSNSTGKKKYKETGAKAET